MGKVYTSSTEAELFIKEHWKKIIWVLLFMVGYLLVKEFIGKPFFP